MNRIIGMGAVIALIFTSGCALFQSSQKASEDNNIVGSINSQPVTYNELKTQYNKSNPVMTDMEDTQGLEEFLPLYMDYRLKLEIAKDAGYLEDPQILEELEQYERQSAYPYWLERHVKDKLLDELYERSGEQIRAKHILISIPENASPADTLDAYEKLMEAREKFLNDEADFMDLSDEYSSRQRGQSMGGDLGYFSAGWAIKPFENAAYALSPGEVSKPVRTSFGYHLIHVTDRTEAGPDKHFSHIFYMTRGTHEPVDTILANAGIAYDELQQGEPWEEVVERYSQDEQSRMTGGAIGWVRFGQYELSFTETIMELDEPGTYTEPFVSQYGIHIVRLDSINKPTEAEKREELAETLRQLPRYRDNERAVLDNAAEIGEARFYRDNLTALEDYLRSSEIDSFATLSIPDSLLNKPVLSFHGATKNGAAFIEWLADTNDGSNHPGYHHDMARDFRDHLIDSELLSLTREHFPEFAELSHDYHTGLSVFRVNEDSVWTYAQQDTARLRQIYEEQSDKYQYDTRYRYVRISARADSTIDRVRNRIEAGEPVDSIRGDFSNVVIRRDVAQNLDNEPHSHLAGLEEGAFSPYFDDNRRRTTIYLEEILEARQMTFEEAYNQLVSEYQGIRETEWLQAMREKYRVEIYPDALKDEQTGNND